MNCDREIFWKETKYLKQIVTHIISGVARGNAGDPPSSEMGKIVIENDVISECSIFSNNFSKNS